MNPFLKATSENWREYFPQLTRREFLARKKEFLSKEGTVKTKDARESVALDVQSRKNTQGISVLRKKYEHALKRISELEGERENILSISSSKPTIHSIEARQKKGASESTAFLIASDWHVEERVDPKVVSDLNSFNLNIVRERADNFWKNGLRVVQLEGKETEISTLVVPLLGDFITNDIHEELSEVNQLTPVEAVLYAQELIASGIKFLLKNSTYDLVFPCHSGNHARNTYRVHVSTEKGHSYEYLLYSTLKRMFEGEKRVKFLLSDGYHSYMNVYDWTIRFHHGHNVRYAGGVGGIYIPINKAIAQWNKAKWADLDVMGHWHQLKDGGNFVINGSLIGYNAYAQSIKADFERPQQACFIIHKKYGRLGYKPIVV